MKKNYSVNTTNSGNHFGIPSRLSFLLPLLLVVFCLFGVNERAWGGTAKLTLRAIANSSKGGYVMVSESSNASFSGTATDQSKDKTGNTEWHGLSSKQLTLYAYASAKAGCVFLGWAESATGTIISTDTKISYTTDKLYYSQTDSKTYYAIFARMVANTPAAGSTTSFEDTNVGSESGWKQIKIDHAHAGTVTISQSGNDGDFFVGATTGATTELSSFESTTETTRTLYVKFVPQNNGLRTCTLTVSSDNGLSSLTYILKGTGYNQPSITWVDGNGSELVSGETTLSVGDVLRASCTTGQTVSYTGYNSNYFTAGTDANGNPILTVKEGISGTINDVSVTGNLAKNTSNYYAAYSDDFSLSITNLVPQTIEWTNDITDISNELIGQTITLNAVAKNAKTGANSGQTITYTMTANSYMSLSGNVLTINNIGGPVAITASALGNANYAPTAVTKYATVIDMTTACYTSDSHSNGQFKRGASHDIYPTLPASLTFNARRESGWLLKDLVITQYNANGKQIKQDTKSYGEITDSGSGSKITISCDPAATTIRFAADGSAKYTYYITNITTTRQTQSSVTYESNAVTSLSYATDPGQKLGKTIRVSYSNIPVFLSFKSDEDANVSSGKSLWSLNTAHFGGCGKKGSTDVTVSFKSDKKGNYTDKLYVRNNVGDLLHTIDLSASVTAQEQFLKSWNIANTYNTTDQVTLQASTTIDNTNFTFTPTTSNPENIVSISNTGVMTFSGSGTATIQAYQPGDDISQEFSTTHNITINKVTPTIATNPDVATIHYLDNFNNNQFSNGLATVTLRGVENTPVPGTFTWTTTLNGQQVTDPAGQHTYSVTFTPTEGGMYNPVTFTMPVTISTATTPTLTMDNTSVDVSRIVSEQEIDHKKTANLTDLVKDLPTTYPMNKTTFTYAFKSVDTSAPAFTGSAASESSAHIDNIAKTFYATEVGVYTLTVTSPATSYYAERSVDFTITVNKLQPTLSFSAEDTVYMVRPVKNAAICVCEGETIATPCIRYSSENENIIKERKIGNEDAYQLICMLDEAAQGASTNVTASYAGNAYFLPAVSNPKTYYAIPKYTPLFFVDGSDNTETRELHVGETATASFVYCVKYDAPSPQVAMTYSINPSSNVIEYDPATKTITAVGAGTATITFTQGLDSYRYPATRTFTFSVLKNATNITLASQVENASQLYVGDKLTGTLYTAATNEVPVDFSSTNTDVIDLIDGELRALSEGEATIKFSINPTGTQALKWKSSSASKTLQVSRRSNTLTSDHTSITKSYGGSEVFTFTASNTDYENYHINLEAVTNGDLVTITRTAGNAFRVMAKHTEGTVTLRATQDISNEYVGATLNGLTFTVGKSNYHVPIDLNASKYNDTYCRTASEGTVSANSSEIQLGKDYWGGGDWDDKYVVFRFDGIPDKLTFGYKGYCTVWDLLGNLNELTNVEWYVQESVDGNFGNDKSWSSSRTDQDSYESVSIQLQPSTRYIKLCYSGNYAGIFKDIHISERSELAAPDPATTSAAPYLFESKPLGADDSEKQFFVDWYNIDKVTVTSSDETHFSVAPASFADYEDYGQVAITVIYHRSVDINTHNATITITNGTQTRYIYVQGETTKKTATITWHPEIEACGFLMNPGETYPADAIDYVAQISNGGNLSISSETEGVISVENNILTAHNVANGSTTKITVNYAGSSEFYPAKLEQVFTVTTDTKQKISWPRTFMNLQLGGAPVPLDAQASSHGTVTYSVADGGEGVVTVVNGALTIVGAGDTYITANQSGGNINGVTYAPISQTKRVHVGDPSVQCTDYAIYNQSCTFASRPQTNAIVYTLEGPAANSVSFSAYHDKASGTLWDNFEALGSYNYNPLVIEEYRYNNNSWEWHPIFNQVVNKETASDYSADVDPTATKLRFYSNEAVTHHISNISLRRRKEVSASETSINASADCNVLYQKTIRVFHSGVDVLTTSVDGGFSLDKETLGEGCGTYGYEELTVSITPSELKPYSGTIVITDGKTDETRLEIPISVVAQPVSQTIIDFYTEATYNTTDNIQFAARVLSGNTVYYTSSNDNIATVDASGKMHITTSGTVTITAHCDATGFYAVAPDVERTFTINKVTPTVSVAPSASDIDLPATLGSSQIDPTYAVMIDDKGTVVTGTYAWADGSMDTHKGEDQYPAIFTPTNSNWYTTADVDITVNVNARGKSIQWSLEDNASFYCFEEITFDAVTVDDLTGEVVDRYVSYTTSAPEIAEVNEVGTLIVHQSGVVTITASASAAGYYDAAQSVSRQIHLNKATPTIVMAPTATPISKEQPLQRSYFHSYSVKVGEYDVPGNFEWNNPEEVIQTPGSYVKPAHFVPSNSVYYNSVDLSVAIRVVQSFWTFVGSESNHSFDEPTNWSNAGVPNEVQPDITVAGDLTLTSDKVLSSMLIDQGGQVTVSNGAHVIVAFETVLSESGDYGDLIVEDGGELTINTPLKVHDFILRSTPSNQSGIGRSGQINNPENLEMVDGNVYFEFIIPSQEETGLIDENQWYGFSVPFPVNIANGGVSRYEQNEQGEMVWNDAIVFDYDYGIAAYNSPRRASGQNGWRMLSGTMLYPGKFYMLGIDSQARKYRFRMDNTRAWQSDEELAVSLYHNANNKDDEGNHKYGDDNWNALGNPNLLYSKENGNTAIASYAYIYKNGTSTYELVSLSSTTFVVGTPFFVQAASAGTMVINPIENKVLAPMRVAEQTTGEFSVTIANANSSLHKDRIVVSASEDAENSYVLGVDLSKFETSTTEPQLWINAYKQRLGVNQTLLQNNSATFSLSLRAPQTGTYTIAQETGGNGTLYLTYEGTVIWNLSLGAYDVDLVKGINSGYGLLLNYEAPAITTDIEESNSIEENIQKLLINGSLYILRDGKMYDATGKIVK